jgi:PKD repeat protein
MKYALALVVFISSLSISAQTKKVLFIGNSYTSYNNLPKMISDAAKTTGDTLIYDSQTLGGYSLKVHSQNATVYSKMRSNTWDFVTIQAQSQEPSFGLNQVRTETFPYAKILADSIRSTNSCAKPLFYMTWGRKNGDPQNCQFVSWLCTYEGMDDSLASRYTYMANVNEGMISPVGRVWRYIRTNNPAIELYDTDGSHPSAAGSYIAMCAFYTTIFHKDPTAITFDYTVKAADAQIIRAAAKLIVFDSLSNWNVGKFDPKPNFSFTQTKDSIETTNSSTYSSNYTWTFGDGNSSNLQNPTHVYNSIGQFNLKLEAEQCGVKSSFSKTVDVTELSKKDTTTQDTATIDTSTVFVIKTDQNRKLVIAPNPAKNTISIIGAYDSIDYTIYDIAGSVKIIGRLEDDNDAIDIKDLSDGIYLIRLSNADLSPQTQRIVKQ